MTGPRTGLPPQFAWKTFGVKPSLVSQKESRYVPPGTVGIVCDRLLSLPIAPRAAAHSPVCGETAIVPQSTRVKDVLPLSVQPVKSPVSKSPLVTKFTALTGPALPRASVNARTPTTVHHIIVHLCLDSCFVPAACRFIRRSIMKSLPFFALIGFRGLILHQSPRSVAHC